MEIVLYTQQFQERWDRFVLNESMNGTFLQTRKFLNYHPEGRFTDASLIVTQGNNIIAVVPACSTVCEGKKCFFSHKGSTYGGIVIGVHKYNVTTLNELIPMVDDYIRAQGYDTVMLKMTPRIFSRKSMDLLDYYLFKQGYGQFNEVSFYVDLNDTPEDLTELMNASRRRDYRYSLKHNLSFRRLESEAEITDFYTILRENLTKFKIEPVHTLQELLDFNFVTLQDNVDFYGVFCNDKLIAGTMLFYFGKQVLHTQYLAQDYAYSNLFTMNFLNYSLIKLAKEKQYDYFSFGISTEQRGAVLNVGLAVFKEGFGCDYCNNRTYIKSFVK